MSVSVITKLIEWLLARKREKNHEIRSYLVGVRDVCEEMISLDDHHTDKAKYLHEKIKTIYDTLSSRIPLTDSNSLAIYQGLSSARVFYWLKVYEQYGDAELSDLLEERHKFSTSQDVLLDLLSIAQSPDDGKYVFHGELDWERVRKSCLSDIARLSNVCT